MPRALNRLRQALTYRREAFDEGLRAAGYEVVEVLDKPEPGDVCLTWNRYGGIAEQAAYCERRGARVIVAENGLLGKSWRGGEWFCLSLGHHAGAGTFVEGGPERWDGWGVETQPWRAGTETLVLGQRGIGEVGIASPPGWEHRAQQRTGGRIRPHPGTDKTATPLAVDLMTAKEVITWHSGAALLALMAGVPVWYDAPHWIGAPAGRPFSEWPGEPKRDDAARLKMLRRLAWAQWDLAEIRSGVPFARLANA